MDENVQFREIVNKIRNEKSHNYDALVISASKKEQRASDAPATIHVINYDQIQARGYISLLDLLEDIPSVEVQRNSSNEFKNSVGIRGISGNEKFMIMMDGIRITPATGDPYAFNHNFSLVNAKRVEVILGPASALYGVDAFSGIINIITKDGKDINGSHISSSFGQYNTYNNAFLAGAQSKGIDFTVSGQRYSSEEPDYQNLYPDEYDWYNSEYKSSGLMGHRFEPHSTIQPPNNYEKSFAMPTETNFLSASLRFGDFEIGANYHDTKHSPAVSNDPKYAVYTDEAFLKTSMQTAYFKHAFHTKVKNSNRSWSLQSTLSYSNFQMDPNSNFINFFTFYDHGYKYQYSKATKIEEQFEYVFSSKLSLIAGTSFELLGALPKTADINKPVDTKLPTDNQDLFYSGSILIENGDTVLAEPLDFYYLNYANYGAYTQFQYSPSHNVEITAGIRYDYNTRFDRSINPRVGLVLKPTESFKIKLLYGSAFLAPSPWKAYLSYGSFERDTDVSEPSLKSDFYHLPNPNLKPEKLQSFEINTIWLPNESSQFSIGAYLNSINDLIALQEIVDNQFEFKNYPITTVETTLNLGSSQTYGINAYAIVSLLKTDQYSLNWYASYDFSDGFIEVSDSVTIIKKRELIASARHMVKSGVDFNSNRFSGSLRFLFRSKSNSVKPGVEPDASNKSDNEHKHKAFSVANFYGKYLLFEEKGTKGFCFMRVSNVLNSRYYHVSVATDSFTATPQDPIRISGGFKLEI
jgi:iron complex outermembrane receptor protein